MKKQTGYVILVILSIAYGSVAAQGNNERIKGRIVGESRFSSDSIQLRWGPTSPELWATTNKYGYIIERLTVRKGKKTIPTQRLLLTPQPYKPWPLEKWEPLVTRSDAAGVVAEALYGEQFSTTAAQDNSPLSKALLNYQERELRFGFALLMADQNYEVAVASGLGFTDRNIKKDETYIYKIYSPIPSEAGFDVDTAYISADFTLQTVLTAPRGLEATFGDRVAELTWNGENFPNQFSGYYLERSDNRRDYKRLNKEPIVYMEGDKEAIKVRGKKVVYRDSLPANDTLYYYRVRGFNAFGELSPASSIIKGRGLAPLTDFPVITIAGVEKKNGHVRVKWRFPEDKNEKLKHFEVRRSNVLDKGVLSKDSTLITLPVTSRVYSDPKPLPFAYYQIVAIGLQGQEQMSNATPIEKIDTIPPAAPRNLVGKIDTLGIVHLSWKINMEPDFLGYRVFRADVMNGKYISQTPKIHKDTTFQDTIEVQTTTRYIYYKLIGMDQRGNLSEFSEVLQLKRPDKIPPVAPVFDKYNTGVMKVDLHWANSSSEDLDSTFIYRRKQGDTEWNLLRRFYKTEISQFTDSTGKNSAIYEYRIRARDESGKFSKEPKNYLVVRWLDTRIDRAPAITLEKQSGQMLLKWTVPPGTKKVYIFRKEASSNPRLYNTIWGVAENSMTDKAMTVGSTYSYRIKVVFEDNTESFFSEEATLTYE